MHPLVDLPLIGTVRSHTLLLMAAIVAAAALGGREAVRAGLDRRRVVWAIGIVAATTFAAGRLHFVLAHLDLFRSRPWRAFALSSSGLHAPGAMIGAIVGTIVVLRVLDLPLGRFVDALAPAAGVGIALARLGCFLHGCCFGIACHHSWGVRFPDAELLRMAQVAAGELPAGAPAPLPAHPLQLYFAASALAITGFLLWLAPRKRFDGEIGVVFLVLFFSSSAVLEPLRADAGGRVYWGAAPQLQWIAGVMAVASGLLLVGLEYRRWARRRRASFTH